MGELGTQVSFLSLTYAFEMAGGELKLSSFSCRWVVNRVLVLPCILFCQILCLLIYFKWQY